MTLKSYTGGLLAAMLVFAAQGAYADKWSDQFPHIKNTGDIPGAVSYTHLRAHET